MIIDIYKPPDYLPIMTFMDETTKKYLNIVYSYIKIGKILGRYDISNVSIPASKYRYYYNDINADKEHVTSYNVSPYITNDENDIELGDIFIAKKKKYYQLIVISQEQSHLTFFSLFDSTGEIYKNSIILDDITLYNKICSRSEYSKWNFYEEIHGKESNCQKFLPRIEK